MEVRLDVERNLLIVAGEPRSADCCVTAATIKKLFHKKNT